MGADAAVRGAEIDPAIGGCRNQRIEQAVAAIRAAGTGAATCGICVAGQYAAAAAAAACTACPGGQFAANAAASQCSACEPGQYSSAVQVGGDHIDQEHRRCMSDADCQYDGCAGAGWEEAHCSGSSDDDSRDCAVDGERRECIFVRRI